MADNQAGGVSLVTAMIQRRSPAMGATKLIAIDGPSGAGKTTLAQTLADSIGARVLSMETLYRGWRGLDAGVSLLVEEVLKPIAVAQAGQYREWDWFGHRPGPLVDVAQAPVLIVDGVGSGARGPRVFASAVIWVDADSQIRRDRALRRDTGVFDAWWDTWAAQEQAHFARHGTESAADLRVRTDLVA